MRYLRSFLPCLFCTVLLGGVFRVSGQEMIIRKAGDSSPIQDVFVFDKQYRHSALSDERGILRLDSFAPADTLVFQHPSYKRVVITKADLKQYNYAIVLKENIVKMHPFVITYSKTRELKREIPHVIETIGSKEIGFANAQTTPDLLRERGGVMVQKSQAGGGSPVIRGFEANKVLLVVDGVRMNNAIYRSGHLQSSLTVDNAALERVEVLFGPGSVVYGSDALGGVVHFYTKNPALATGGSKRFNIGAFSRFSTANNENTAHFDVNMGFKKIGFFTSATTSQFGDLRMGAVRQPGYPDFGKVFHYALRTGDNDSMVVNDNHNIQRFTGYGQVDLLQKTVYKPSDNFSLTLNTQLSNSSDIPRFDRLNDYKNGLLKYAEWHYGPQKRLLTSLKATVHANNKLFDVFTPVVAYQRIKESRITRKFNDPKRVNRKEFVDVYSVNMDFVKQVDTLQRMHYGFEANYNDVISVAGEENIESGAIAAAATRYPDGGSYLRTLAGYMGYKRKLAQRTHFHTGFRYSNIKLHSEFNDTSFIKLPFDRVDYNISSLSGSIGLVLFPVSTWQINLVASTGFRAPNVDDYGKVFAKNGNVVVPNDRLKPEYAYNGEVGMTKTFIDKAIRLTGTFFYTLLEDVIVRRDFQLAGQDSLLIDGEMNKIQANTNSNQAYIYGCSAKLTANFSERISFENSYNYTYGYDVTARVPLGHIPPVYGKASVNFKSKRVHSSFYTHFNGWKKIALYSPSGVDNEDEATPDGTPAWYTLNLSNIIVFSGKIKLLLALENILDTHYRPFASGVSAPGRNLIVAIRIEI